jgi:hypothetical protein
MANYKNIKGFSIQYLDSDPPNPIEGQIWFNSTSGTFKGTEVGLVVNPSTKCYRRIIMVQLGLVTGNMPNSRRGC